MSTALVPIDDAQELERDPVQYMAVVLNRAKGWLAEAQSVDEVRNAKAVAVGYESVIREKELAFDAQLSATEIVRRCERRIGELVRIGQSEGTVFTSTTTRGSRSDRKTVIDAAGVVGHSELTRIYAMSDADDADFETALADAKAEGNLSRANVVRKVKGEPAPIAERSEWHHKTRHINSDRILLTLAQEIDGAAQGLDLMDPAELDRDLRDDCVGAIRQSITVINRHLRRITNE